MAHPLFFFSYARGNWENAEGGRFSAAERHAINSIDEFYHALGREVADLSGLSADEVGFIDQEDLELSAPWPEKLVEALKSAAVMVALFSPTYFLRPACGREFEFFRQRQITLEKSLGRALDYRILPILWTRPDRVYSSIPSRCRADILNLQLMPPDAPACYKSLGLKQMFNTERRAEWNEFCALIAKRICDLAQSDVLPPLDGVDFNSLPSAFHELPPLPGEARPVDPGRREIRVYYLVPTKAEWSEVSGTTNADFNEHRNGAHPFSDAPDIDVAHATENGIVLFKPEIGVTHENLPKDIAHALKDADDTFTTILLVFDRRSLRIPLLKRAVTVYAEGDFKNTGFVTVAGDEVPDNEVVALRQRKTDSLPRLQIWRLPAGCKDYILNVASVVAEQEMQLVRRKMEMQPTFGGAIPGLSGPTGS